MIYAVIEGIYSDWEILGYFTNREDADKYTIIHPNSYIIEIQDLTNKVDFSGIAQVNYTFYIVFDKNINNKWVIRDFEREYYTCYKGKLKNNSIVDGLQNNWIKFIINTPIKDRKKAEKIAIDYLYILIEKGITSENIEELNKMLQKKKENEQ